ncbi:ABC transporter ATP-binding protein [Parapedobacter indicus]|uniref:ATP-binding cassette, subfamily B n=1 Tax=Parapedobacter indicus TaxID=1477437 RepID=A0A1I3DJS5_9SPHI|nr:ABC transporter ATP-binding protein [Parapedobacter indicus]PPL04716.1 ATP-binding cassette subfamily B protein [Parapedobacter indicus]SFH86994.1 ATP-binding cassette, subfamily B [Parapedobacter indicus]
MNYNLNQLTAKEHKTSTVSSLKRLLRLIAHERKNLLLALLTILINATLNLLGPYIIGHTIDAYVITKQYHGLFVFSAILLGMYLAVLLTSYLQTKLMGSIGQRLLFTLRNAIFNKLQRLPVAFFNQNKAGDLISRVNNDTDKLNQFFSQALTQFIGSIATMTGAGIFLLVINVKLGLAALSPAIFILLFTKVVSPWVKKKNALNLKSTGSMSAEIQESLDNFKVIVAFNRRDYFRKRFDETNKEYYGTAIRAGLANTIFLPVYSLFSSLAQLTVLAFGIYLITIGEFTVGLLVSYLAYCVNFYHPLRQLASLWSSFQVAMAGWDRISQILSLETNLNRVTVEAAETFSALLEFKQVHFAYPNGKEILHDINLRLEKGKTYALVGPTGGGKTTTASLMARLYDPTQGVVLLKGRDIRSYEPAELAQKIGFILQEPFLFSGTVKENILYGNGMYNAYTDEQLKELINVKGLEELLSVFDRGLDTVVSSNADNLSLGVKQVIAFIRAVLRDPELLILDEATANIDTVTEQLLEKILKKLPEETTLVIIAHRLNTIENADEIFFVNLGEVTRAGSFREAINRLMQGKRAS